MTRPLSDPEVAPASLPSLASLSDALIGEVVKAFGVRRSPRTLRLFRPFFHRATDRLAALGLNFDTAVAEAGPAAAARDLLAEFCHPVRASGAENIPLEGPTLIVSNHPGTYDSLALFSQVARPDLRFISSSIPFVKALPHASQRFIYVTIDAHARTAGVRQALRHLQNGGSVALFGSGHIDPDPAVYDPQDSLAHIQGWWPSVEFLLNKAPSTNLVISMVSQVVSPRWARHPITWLRRKGVDRRRLAELGQLIQQLLVPGLLASSPCISFSEPYPVGLLRQESGPGPLMPSILLHAADLLQRHLTEFDAGNLRPITLHIDSAQLFTRI